MEQGPEKDEKKKKRYWQWGVLMSILAFLMVRTDLLPFVLSGSKIPEMLEKKYHEKFIYEVSEVHNGTHMSVYHPEKRPEIKVRARFDGFDLHDNYVPALIGYEAKRIAEPLMKCKEGEKLFWEPPLMFSHTDEERKAYEKLDLQNFAKTFIDNPQMYDGGLVFTVHLYGDSKCKEEMVMEMLSLTKNLSKAFPQAYSIGVRLYVFDIEKFSQYQTYYDEKDIAVVSSRATNHDVLWRYKNTVDKGLMRPRYINGLTYEEFLEFDQKMYPDFYR